MIICGYNFFLLQPHSAFTETTKQRPEFCAVPMRIALLCIPYHLVDCRTVCCCMGSPVNSSRRCIMPTSWVLLLALWIVVIFTESIFRLNVFESIPVFFLSIPHIVFRRKILRVQISCDVIDLACFASNIYILGNGSSYFSIRIICSISKPVAYGKAVRTRRNNHVGSVFINIC